MEGQHQVIVVQDVLRYLEEIHHTNLQCLDMLTEHQLDFQPVPEVMSIRMLLYHMYVNQKFYVQSIISSEMDVEEYRHWMQLIPTKKEALRSFIDGVFSETQALFDDPHWFTLRLQTPAGERTVPHLLLGELEHQLHHRGQLYTYMRLLGLTPPTSGYFMGLGALEQGA
jgi:uncharacterized damage-inducible protein DinB